MYHPRKSSKRGAFFVEYALILAFVVICGTALLSNNEISLKINNIITSTVDLLKDAVGLTGGSNAGTGEQTQGDTNTSSTSHGQGSIHADENGLENGKGHKNSTEESGIDRSEESGIGAGLVGQ